ncbi:DNA polymerase thumb domain-containing protein [Chitinimonas sp. PSY-7]|uniref:DNA polymerase thumb domain-containing protein n=1 Tax=Chitinimonas sp. PSY-7 TaxID=3459088 RepID=UPI00403FCF0D
MQYYAKVASDWNKPDGQFVVHPRDADAFVATLPVDKLFGVGKVTAAKLKSLGAQSCADLRAWPLPKLVQHFGRFGQRLFELCRGIDNRPVINDHPRKSLSVETTYAHDLTDWASCLKELQPLIDDLYARQQRSADTGRPHKTFVKIRFDDFSHTTVECVCSNPNAAIWTQLLSEGWQPRSRPVRLLGVGFRYEEETHLTGLQLGLFDTPESEIDAHD